MYKIMIVDDNSLIRQSIRARVNWADLNMTVIDEAKNGEEALEKIKISKPDIVITDIKMPKADGFSIIEKTKEILPHIQYIIISGYDDFQYTKKAILYNIVNYILKPINNEELIEALTTAKNNIVDCNNQHKNIDLLGHLQKKELYQQINSSFISYFNNNLDLKDLLKLLIENHIELNYSSISMVSINIIGDISTNPVYKNDLTLFNLHDLIKSHFSRSNIHVIPLNKYMICFLINTDNNSLYSQKLYWDILEFFKLIDNNLMIYMGVSKPYDDITMLSKIYNEAIDALFSRFTVDEDTYLYSYTSLTSDYTVDDNLRTQIRISMKLGLDNKVTDSILSLFEHAEEKKMNAIDFRYLVDELLGISKKIVRTNKLDENLTSEKIFDKYFLLKFKSSIEIKKHLISICKNICLEIRNNKTVDIGEIIIEYIHSNYTNSISLNQLADIFYVNAVYLGQLLKKQTGFTFNKYINMLRIERAKKIIETTDEVKLNELAYSLGYSDSHYFSKVFKQITKNTPSQYKINYLKE